MVQHADIDHTGLPGVGSGGGAAPFVYKDSSAAGAHQALSTTFTDLFPSQLNPSIPAVAGDVLRIELQGEMTDTDGQWIAYDFTINGVRVGQSTRGILKKTYIDNEEERFHVFYLHKVVSGDISGGNVAVKAQVRDQVGVVPDVKYTAPVCVLVVTNMGQSL